jgi:hypothetical protein
MDHHEEHEESAEQAPDSTGDRPETPSEGTGPPATQEPDSERVEEVEEDLDRTGAN